MKPKCIDLFAGCGGLSLGLHKAGFECVLAAESHPDAFATYKQNFIDPGLTGSNWPDWLDVGPVNVVALAESKYSELASLRGKIDLVAGGPPCQGFSMNGRRNPDDPRSRMVDAYLEIVSLVRPKLVLLENVRGIVSMPHSSGVTYAEAIQKELSSLGYDTWSDIFLTSDWGVPQKRPRYICIAALKGSLPGVNPLDRLRTARRGFLSSRGLWPGPTTVKEAISDLALDNSPPHPDNEWGKQGFMAVAVREGRIQTTYQKLMRQDSFGQPSDRRIARHSSTTVARFQNILDTCVAGVSLRPVDRKRLGIGKRSTTPLHPDLPSPTVTTLPDDIIHYSDPRTLSVREMARLQSFPDWFSFCGPYTTGGERRRDACPRYTQVGNAVPPLFAEALGGMLLGLLLDQKPPKSAESVELREEV